MYFPFPSNVTVYEYHNTAINKEYGQIRTVAGIAWTVKQFTNKIIGNQRKERTEDTMRDRGIYLLNKEDLGGSLESIS